MAQSANLWLYFLVVSGVIILPGMDMAFVMGSSMAGGRRTGLAAVAGIVAGGFCHMAIGATGIGVVLKLVPAAFTVMLVAGAGYIGWIGWGLLRAAGFAAPTPAGATRTTRQSFFRAMATCLLNPKAYLFMLAIFPQFVRVDRGSVWPQVALLSLITAATQIAVYGTLALAAAHAQSALAARPHCCAWIAKGVGLLLMAAAGFTLYRGIAGP